MQLEAWCSAPVSVRVSLQDNPGHFFNYLSRAQQNGTSFAGQHRHSGGLPPERGRPEALMAPSQLSREREERLLRRPVLKPVAACPGDMAAASRPVGRGSKFGSGALSVGATAIYIQLPS